jgi:signal peptidase II
VFALLVIALDQTSKALAIANLTPQVSYEAIGSLLRLYLTYNDSAAFSIGFGQTWIFAIIGFVALVCLVWYLLFMVETKSWAIIGGILAGGIAGNLIDRLFREPGFGQGLVVDFIQIPFNFPIFNLADSAIVCVAVTVVIRVMLGHPIGKK